MALYIMRVKKGCFAGSVREILNASRDESLDLSIGDSDELSNFSPQLRVESELSLATIGNQIKNEASPCIAILIREGFSPL